MIIVCSLFLFVTLFLFFQLFFFTGFINSNQVCNRAIAWFTSSLLVARYTTNNSGVQRTTQFTPSGTPGQCGKQILVCVPQNMWEGGPQSQTPGLTMCGSVRPRVQPNFNYMKYNDEGFGSMSKPISEWEARLNNPIRHEIIKLVRD